MVASALVDVSVIDNPWAQDPCQGGLATSGLHAFNIVHALTHLFTMLRSEGPCELGQIKEVQSLIQRDCLRDFNDGFQDHFAVLSLAC